MKFIPALAATALMLIPGLCRAGIDFENTTQALTAKISEAHLSASFNFSISGDKPVTIKDIHAFCSCVKAETKDKKMTYAPGEKSSIETVFEVGGFEGTLRKELVISTDDPDHPEVRLVMEVTIPALYQITPNQLVWQTGSAPEPKSVRLKVLGEDPVHITAAVSSRSAMTTAVKEITAGREYEVQVTPQSTEKKMLGLVRLELDSKYPRYQKRLVFFNITDKPAAAAAPASAPAATAAVAPPPVPGEAPKADAKKP
ncbi:MAG: DUF1573 domain-containing protein [Verrucomicrobiaceae bacterium]|nr:MAG: DUF1573 domain-containing protein [Verrucomicrobiaceae bacterium]